MVSSQAFGESRYIRTLYTQQDQAVALQLATEAPLQAEHTNAPISERTFRAAGMAVVTSAEGLVDGDQEYCALFRGRERLVAVGYEGGLYTYEPYLGEGEWVRILAEDETAVPSQARTRTPWKELAAVASGKLLMEDVVQGADTFRDIGYKPWAAVLPSTRVPESIRIERRTSLHEYGQNIEEVSTGNKRFFVTEKGDFCDIYHIGGYVQDTVSLFSQLYYQSLTGESFPISLKLASVKEARFEAAVDNASLQPDTLIDTTTTYALAPIPL